MGVKRFGYWRQDKSEMDTLPDPRNFIDTKWDPDEMSKVIQRLQLAVPHTYWLGFSSCRICRCRNGTMCMTFDGSWIWPEGLLHYVETHSLRPPQDFIDHLFSIPKGMVMELTRHNKANDQILAKWHPHMEGDGCPDKGTRCEHQDKGYPLCKRKNVRNGFFEWAEERDTCGWAEDSLQADLKSERIRHFKALDPFIVIPWERLQE